MVPGIDSFREKFKDYTDDYTIIGGTACDILLSEADLPFRATKDIDMILIMEDNFPEFASVFWEYIKEGGYKCGWKNEQNMHLYRFTEGKFGYPTMIELFSRKPGYHLEIEEGIIPIHIDDDTSSLSAILLNDDFYKFMMSGRRVVDIMITVTPESIRIVLSKCDCPIKCFFISFYLKFHIPVIRHIHQAHSPIRLTVS